MAAPKRTGLPFVPQTDVKSRQFFEAIKEKLEVADGLRGDPLEQKLTWRDLIDLGFAKAAGRIISGKPIVATDMVSALPIANMAVPPLPVGFAGVGILGGVTLIWDNPHKIYSNHGYTEVFRSQADDFATAELIGRDNGGQYSDWDVQPAGQYYYWIRNVSVPGVQGPIQSTAGLFVEVPVSAEWLLNELSGQIKEEHLFNDLNTRLDTIEENKAAIQVAQADIDDMGVYWTVKTTVGDLTGGFGFYNDGTKTSFAVSADLFYVFNPANNTGSLPFIIQNGAVYMNTAFIKDASIDSAKIGSVTFGKVKDANGNPVTTVGGLLKADYLDVDDLIANYIATDFLQITSGVVSDTIKSANYNGTSTGWQISASGAINCYNLTAKGNIEASSLKASAANIVNTLHLAGNAVRVLEYYDYSAAYSGTKGSNTYLTVDTFSMDFSTSASPGVVVFFDAGATFQLDEAQRVTQDIYGYVYLQLVRGSTLVKEVVFWKGIVSSDDPSVNVNKIVNKMFMLFDSPPQGFFTYTIRLRFYNHDFEAIACSGQYTVDGAKA